MNPVIASCRTRTQAWGITINHQLSQSQSISFTWWRNHYVTQEENAQSSLPVTR